MVHRIVKRRTTGGHQPELFGLLRREAARSESRSGGFRFKILLGFAQRDLIRSSVVGFGVNVVGIGGPAEERSKPVGRGGGRVSAMRIAGGGTGTDSDRSEGDEIGSH